MLGVGLAVVVLAGPLLGGCGRKEFADRTARVTVDGATTEYQVDSCGRDQSTVFVVGRADGGRILQAVVGLRPDNRTGIPASTGITLTGVEVARTSTTSSAATGSAASGSSVPAVAELAAFGAESWARRGETGDPPGRIASARVRGSRIQVSGDLEPAPSPDAAGSAEPVRIPFTLDARCDRTDD